MKFWQNRPRITISCILIGGFLISLLIQFSHLGYWQKHESFFYDDGKPLMSTLDAYYYLRIASDLSGGQNEDEQNEIPVLKQILRTPLPASVIAIIHKAFHLPIDNIAFYLPPVLGAMMVIVYVLWGNSLGGPGVALLTTLAGISSFFWCKLTCLGRLDADCLNPFFVYLILFFIYKFVMVKGRARALYLSTALLTAGVFGLWWLEVRYLGIILLALSYSLTFYLPSSKVEKGIKFSILAATGLMLLCTFSFDYLLPKQWLGIIKPYTEKLTFIYKEGAANSKFPNVAESITELKPLPISEMSKMVGGHLICVLASIVGFVFMVKRNRRVVGILGVGFALALLSFVARRFLIFVVPLYALGLGYFLGNVLFHIKLPSKFKGPYFQFTLLMVIAGGLLLPSFYLSLTNQAGPSVGQADVYLARKINAQHDGEAMVWAWWDYGYFLQYITGHKTFIDGGSQSPERTFIAAFPLSCNDPVLSRNWMRFFAAHGSAGLQSLAASLGSHATALSFLKYVLASPARSFEILESYGFSNVEIWNQFLFPDALVFVFLNRATLSKSIWWYYYGTWDSERQEGNHPDLRIVRTRKPASLIERGFLTIGGQSIKLHAVFGVGRYGAVLRRIYPESNKSENERVSYLSPEATKNKERKIALYLEGTDQFYLTDMDVVQALAFKLAFLRPFETSGFSAVAYDPVIGGVWRLQ